MGLLRRLVGRRARRRREAELARLNLKFFGYEMARRLAATLPARLDIPAQTVLLESKAATQNDIESDWLAHWASEMKVPIIYHRKLWELAFVLQVLHQHDLLRDGTRGLGFGCGAEPIASYLASRGVTVTASDLSPTERKTLRWQDSEQHASLAEQYHHAHLIDRATFDARVEVRVVDMTAIPAILRDYDFNWSVCALEHLGSIGQGLDFLERCLATLRPGGLAVHTTEFNFLDDHETIDNWHTVLFQKRHFEALKARLEAHGHVVAPLNFDVGDKPMDRFIDLPPYVHQWPKSIQSLWGGDPNHIKMAFDGFACTSFGLVIRKAASRA